MVRVKVSDLRKMVEELEKDEIEYVDISEYEEEIDEDGEIIPNGLHFEGNDGYGGGVDFEVIEHTESSVFYKAERERQLEDLGEYFN